MKKGYSTIDRVKVTYKGETKLLNPGHKVYRLNLLNGTVTVAELIPVYKAKKVLGIKVGTTDQLVGYMIDEQKHFHYLPASSLYNAIKLFKQVHNDLIKKGELTIITKA